MKKSTSFTILVMLMLPALLLPCQAAAATDGAMTKPPVFTEQPKVKPPMTKLDSGPKTIAVTSPGSGTIFAIGSTYAISWKYTGEAGTVKIELVNISNKSASLIATDVPGGQRGLGSSKWLVPQPHTPAAAGYLVKVTSLANAAATGLSQPFSIAPPSITIIRPTPGQRCSTIANITWTSLGDTFGSTVRITAWSADIPGAAKDLDIQVPLNQRKYEWNHPVDKDQNFYIRVESAQNPSIADQRLIHMMGPIQGIGTPGPEPWKGGAPVIR
jgi:hypothetical protein